MDEAPIETPAPVRKYSRRRLLKLSAVTIAGAWGVPLVSYGYGRWLETEWLSVDRVPVPIKGLASALDGLRIVQMSDFHIYPFTRIEFARRCIEAANTLKPDVVVLTGDYVLDSAESIFDLAPALQNLDAKHGVFASLGNHDYKQGIVHEGLKNGVTALLENDGVAIAIGDTSLYLAGLASQLAGRPDLDRAMANWRPGMTTVALVHEPDAAPRYSSDGRVALQLSGHSHGGQVRVPFRGATILPVMGRKYDMGLYDVGSMKLYVNRGIGCYGIPVRFNCRPEITEITLTAA